METDGRILYVGTPVRFNFEDPDIREVLTENLPEDFEEDFMDGVIVGLGENGVVVEFPEFFLGHAGLGFEKDNGLPINENTNHWFFDFDESPDFGFTFTTSMLETNF